MTQISSEGWPPPPTPTACAGPVPDTQSMDVTAAGGRAGGEGGGGDEPGLLEHDNREARLGGERGGGDVPGGMFAGVGEFSPTQRNQTSEEDLPPQLADLDMKYTEESMLRW